MLVTIKIGFFIDYSYAKHIESFFNEYDIHVSSPKKGVRTSEISYDIPVVFRPEDNVIAKMEEIRGRLLKLFPIDHTGEEIIFSYDNEEYDKAPFFRLQSTGNSASANITNNNSAMKTEIFCKACGLKRKELESHLVMDTSKLKSRYMVNIDSMFWVVSEKMAELMAEWNITGYQLKEVEHRGKPENRVPAYQLITENSLPPLSPNTKYYYFVSEPEERCDVCGIKGKVHYPYLYDQSDIENYTNDLYLVNEWASNGSYAYHRLLLSQRFRSLLLENKITRDVRSLYEDNYGSKDWFMTPVFIDKY
ncbi:hypothetical protein [Paenibacillus sanguinis]|uniref:hypothetical protein n=1 Tax=Paenibacillus sanguinis TaxID=225906 RepID=UPI0003823719|nr:hypothetical protein [Paenibacillus sanguinis]